MGKKAAGRGAAGSASSASSANRIKTDAMPKEEVSKMLSMLKYNSSNSAKTTPDKREEAKNALDLYRSLDQAGKRDFFKRFSLSKKDLSWVNTFVEVRSEGGREESGTEKGFFNGHQILQMNGFNPSDFGDAERESLIKDLLAECATIHDVECAKVDHENPLLIKWHYVKTLGSKSIEERSWKKEHQEQIQTAKGENVAGEDSAGTVKVKIENAFWQPVKVAISAVKSGKGALAKVVDQVQDLCLALQSKPPDVQEKGKEIEKCCESLEAAMRDTRSLILKFDGITIDSAKAETLKEAEETISWLQGHIDGAKIVIKRVKAVMA